MKKSQKILTALVLSTTLALGAVPAFAVDASVGDAGSFDVAKKTASTTMNVYTLGEDQIQATVPLNITVVTPAKGGVITAPSATAYKIVNNGSMDIKVTKIEGIDNAGWKVVDTLTTPDQTGQVKMTIKAGASSEVPILSGSNAKAIEGADAGYFVAAKEGGELGLTLAGNTAVKGTLDAEKTYPSIKIQYTVDKVTTA